MILLVLSSTFVSIGSQTKEAVRGLAAGFRLKLVWQVWEEGKGVFSVLSEPF